MAHFWVIGGEYADTGFDRIVGGGTEERHGPFATREQAHAEWQRLAWRTVDNAMVRYRIEQDVDANPALHYWVVGGHYADTSFAQPEGGAETWHGPYADYETARAKWGQLAWSTVDDALARWRIEQIAGDPPVDARRAPA